jgi:hypothetical protein
MVDATALQLKLQSQLQMNLQNTIIISVTTMFIHSILLVNTVDASGNQNAARQQLLVVLTRALQITHMLCMQQ